MHDTKYDLLSQSTSILSTWPAAVLIVHANKQTCETIRGALAELCALIEVVHTPTQAEQLLYRYHFDVLIIDDQLPHLNNWIQTQQSKEQSMPFLLVNEQGKIINSDQLSDTTDPASLQKLVAIIAHAFGQAAPALSPNICTVPSCQIGKVVQHSEAMQKLFSLIRRIASRPATVLLQGESGTGKEIVAQSLHCLSGRSGAFVPVNCGALAPELLESEFFGHARGAFTGANQSRPGLFAYAQGGTLLLDEISELPLTMQATLLRVLEERAIRPVGMDETYAIDVRIITATNRDLAGEVTAGRFREDLYYRLNVVSLRIPPLRERPDDIEPLLQLFSQQLAQAMDLPPLALDARELQHLQAYSWPGNVRELRNLVERAMLLDLSPIDCLENATPANQQHSVSNMSDKGYPTDLTLADVERHHSLKVLAASGGNKSKASRRLGISRKTLERKLKLWEADNYLNSHSK